MAYRNLSQQYEALRLTHRPAGFQRNSQTGKYEVVQPDDIENQRPNVNAIKSPSTESVPEYVEIVSAINADMHSAREALQLLSVLHRSILKVQFDDASQADQAADIDTLSMEISQRLKRSENNLKKIALVNNKGDLPQQERIVRMNLMRTLATDLQILSKQYRVAQKDYMSALKEREQIGIELGFEDSEVPTMNLDEALERGLTEEQAAQIQEMEQHATQREAEILRIAQSVNELAQMFRELNVLVIEQGTILDRIDYNIEQTVEKVKEGTTQLVEAERISKKAYTAKCLASLVVVTVILFLILVIKKS